MDCCSEKYFFCFCFKFFCICKAIKRNWFSRKSKGYSKPWQTSKMECFAKIVKYFYQLTIFGKRSILDVWQGSEYVSAIHSLVWANDLVIVVIIYSNTLREKCPYSEFFWVFKKALFIVKHVTGLHYAVPF